MEVELTNQRWWRKGCICGSMRIKREMVGSPKEKKFDREMMYLILCGVLETFTYKLLNHFFKKFLQVLFMWKAASLLEKKSSSVKLRHNVSRRGLWCSTLANRVEEDNELHNIEDKSGRYPIKENGLHDGSKDTNCGHDQLEETTVELSFHNEYLKSQFVDMKKDS